MFEKPERVVTAEQFGEWDRDVAAVIGHSHTDSWLMDDYSPPSRHKLSDISPTVSGRQSARAPTSGLQVSIFRKSIKIFNVDY